MNITQYQQWFSGRKLARKWLLQLFSDARFFVLLQMVLSAVESKPTTAETFRRLVGCHKGHTAEGVSELKQFVDKLGYLNLDGAKDDEFDEDLESGIKAYQSRSLRIFLGNLKWPTSKIHLTYNFRSSVEVLLDEDIRSVCFRAFKQWADVSRFTFEEVSDDYIADIEIGFIVATMETATRWMVRRVRDGLATHASICQKSGSTNVMETDCREHVVAELDC
ncbi:hypothetical protein F3Y22_tig00110266pilonHSYRG00078 [Hibiscus syriacus]|uniref:Uncharacterized protein n=1 Tax=Hibiscus syriacus TaxID=106335 RepID=A0A6A3B683_HIBSY|nr:hypothetical protein F3Y22_tig00110266pilonHSYRG00078 [Hibiscus syriacus]